MRHHKLITIYCLVALSAPVAEGVETIDFNRDIRPILSNNCFLCHGPDDEDRKGGRRGSGGLRLDTFEGATQDLDGYAALVPGEPDESELLFLMTTDFEDERMPPAKHGKALSEEEITLVRQWIEEGGEYDLHWSYKKVERPKEPKVDGSVYVSRNEIDRFVVDRLASESLEQSPEADRYALARRVALDLTGLPPSLEEVDAFVADTKPGAYGRFVDRGRGRLSARSGKQTVGSRTSIPYFGGNDSRSGASRKRIAER